MKIYTTLLLILFNFIFNNVYSQKELLGMTSNGGLYNGGTIFKTDSSGNNFQNIFSFPRTDGRNPGSGLTEYPNGLLYGLTSEGGIHNLGTLYEFNPVTYAYSKKVDFDTLTGGTPLGFLFMATDDHFYGLASTGGAHGAGTIFKYDPSGDIFTKIFDFDDINSGSSPVGNLVQAPNGKLFGTTYNGGVNSKGVIFEYDPVSNIYTKLFDFDGPNLGSYPREGMILANDSMLYGTSGYGGSHGFGVLYQLDPDSGTIVKKYEFDNITLGSPEGNLTQASNGLIYGLSEFGIPGQSSGQLFEYDPLNDTILVKYEGFSAVNGMRPSCKITEINSGILTGMTLEGGTQNLGVIWEYNIPNDSFIVRHEFDGLNGSSPYGTSVYKTSAGKLIGITSAGGQFGGGCIFEYDSSSFILNRILNFDDTPDGKNPSSNFLLASNGKLYSMTLFGGTRNEGVLFELDPLTNNYSKRIDFDRQTIGGLPEGSLIQASNGKLYGMTSKGGNHDDGVLFEFDPVTTSYNKLFDFDSLTVGAVPMGSLVQSSNGLLYGLTSEGGINNFGTIFEYSISNDTMIKKMDFDGTMKGSNPMGSLLEASNNMLYGLTSTGGDHNMGVLFQWDPVNNIYSKLVDFNDTISGMNPMGSLIESVNTKLYGLTSRGGAHSDGLLFEFNTTNNQLVVKQEFDDNINAYSPNGSLCEASNGKLYGTTVWGGFQDNGIVFEYDSVSNSINNKFDFTNAGSGNSMSDIIEIDLTLLNTIMKTEADKHFSVYPNPAMHEITISSSDISIGVMDIIITDITGKFIYSSSIEGLPYKLIIDNLSPGFYLLKFMIDNSVYARKIVKQ